MDLDVLKEKWAEQDQKLDLSIRLNRKLLMAVHMNRVQSPLRRFAAFSGMGALLGLITLTILGRFIYDHWQAPRFALPAVTLHLWVIAYVAASIRQMVLALRIDLNKPIAKIQQELGSLQVLRLRVVLWGVLSGQLVWWIPFLVVALKGIFKVDAYEVFPPAFLIANVALGVALIPLSIWMSRKFVARLKGSPWMERLVRELAGYNLTAANGFLAALQEFENETCS